MYTKVRIFKRKCFTKVREGENGRRESIWVRMFQENKKVRILQQNATKCTQK